MNPIEIESLNGMSVFITNMITKDVQARKHRKKRINKKWIKRYGMKIVEDDSKIIATKEMLFMTRKCFQRLNKEIQNGGNAEDFMKFQKCYEELLNKRRD